MAIIVNGTTPTSFTYNGVNLTSIWCEGIQVWPDSQTVEPYVWLLLDNYGTVKYNGRSGKTLEYSLDKTNWTSFANGSTITVPAHYKVYLRSLNSWSFSQSGNTGNNGIQVTGSPYYVGGDISSLFNGATTLPAFAMQNFFRGDTNLISADGLSLSYLTLSRYCYQSMFNGCNRLTSAPSLPATTLNEGCYSAMFRDCFYLKEAPSLPATTLADSCYQGMFARCISLIKIPSLPATVLPWGCYIEMYMTANIIGILRLKFSPTMTSECPNEYRLPASGTATYGTGASSDADVTKYMFAGLINASYEIPPINRSYYTNATVV